MAIKFQDKNDEEKPAEKEVGGKTYVAEEPAPAEKPDDLPFAKSTKPEKKGRKVR